MKMNGTPVLARSVETPCAMRPFETSANAVSRVPGRICALPSASSTRLPGVTWVMVPTISMSALPTNGLPGAGVE